MFFLSRIFGRVHRALPGVAAPWTESQIVIPWMATGGHQRIIFTQELAGSVL